MSAFSIQIPFDDPKAMEQFQEMMDELHDAQMKYVEQVMQENNVSFSCANHIVYLRSRSRWSMEKEAELIRLYSINQPPNMGDF